MQGSTLFIDGDGSALKTRLEIIELTSIIKYDQTMSIDYAQRLKDICASRGGVYLSTYVTGKIKMTFRCRNDHEWVTVPSSIVAGSWCAICQGQRCDLIKQQEKLAQICQSKGGRLLGTYSTRKESIEVECAAGHTFSVRTDSLTQDKWCAVCIGHHQPPAFYEAEIDLICQSRNGTRMSSYVRGDVLMKFLCSEGHEFEYQPRYIKNNDAWCNKCNPAGSRDPLVQEHVIDLLCLAKGGKRLGPYCGSYTPILIRCAVGHEWSPTPANLKQHSWCKHCRNKSEATCREILESTLNAKFPSVRPDFLMYKSGWPLELDGYCPELNIAMEFDGEQHDFFNSHFHKDEWDLIDQQERDQFKLDKLIELKIDFIRISHLCDTDDKKRNFIMYRLAQIFKERGMSADEIVARFGENDYDTIQRDYPTLTW